MLAMPGMRAFSLAAKRGNEGVSCDASGVFVGGVPLLRPPSAERRYWTVRPAAEINEELTVRYGLPIDFGSKAGAVSLIAAALNRGDLAIASIAAVQMQFPDPPPLGKTAGNLDDRAYRASELRRSGLLKVWEANEHPRTGAPPNPGWFAPVDGGSEAPEQVAMEPDPFDPYSHFHPVESMGGRPGEGGDVGSGPEPQLPPPEGSVSPQDPSATSTAPEATPRSWTPTDPTSRLPFMGEAEPLLAPYKEGGPTSGIFKAENLTVELRSGYDGPSANMPDGSPGFDGRTMAHVEAQAAALMQQQNISKATLSINNPEICERCTRLLERMLPLSAILNVVLPDGTVKVFRGASR